MDFRIDQNRTTNLKEFVVDTLRRQTHATTFRALDDVSFTAEKGSVTGLIGHNGAGKSTLLKIISGIYPPTSGSVALQGTLVAHARTRQRLRRGTHRAGEYLP